MERVSPIKMDFSYKLSYTVHKINALILKVPMHYNIAPLYADTGNS